jgi:hypothetical protein
MNQLALLFIVFSVCFTMMATQSCSYTDIRATASKLNGFIANFSDPNYFPANFENQTGTIEAEAAGCFQVIGSLVTFADVAVTSQTDDCVVDSTSSAWKTDACCNPALQQSQCCAVRTVNETESRVTGFTAALTQKCSNPARAKPLVDEFITSFRKRIDRCNTIVKGAFTDVNSLEKRMIGCFAIFAQAPKCKSDADCFGGTCSEKTKACVFKGPEDPNPVLNCIFAQIPPVSMRNIRQKLGFKGISPLADVLGAFKNATIANDCQDVQGNSLPLNSTTCLAQKQCNLPLVGGNCPTQGACAFCDERGICDQVLPGLNNQTCAAAGFCLGVGPTVPGTGAPFNKATCENGTFKYCTAYGHCNELNGCNASTCANSGDCIGFPFLQSTCVFAPMFDEAQNTFTCPAGRTFSDEGCADATFVNTTSCTAAGGMWYKLPTSKSECEAFMGCQDPLTKIFSLKNQGECTKCKETYKSRYAWDAGVWTNSVFFQGQKWVMPAQVSVNRFIKAINGANLQKIVQEFLHFEVAPSLKSYLQCAYAPVVNLFESIACDCGTSKGPNGTCYPTTQPNIDLGTTKAFAGLETLFSDPSVNFLVSNSTVDSTRDVDSFVVGRTPNPDIHATADVSNYYDMFNIHFLNQANAVVGVAVSSGFSVKTTSGTALSAPVKLCIARDKRVVVGPTYTVAAFATKDGSGNLVKTSLSLIGTDYSQQMCANVQTSNTYYAAFFTTGATTSTTPGTSPNKPVGSSSTALLAVLAVLFSVLGYMF